MTPPARILIVEDDASIRETIGLALDEAGYEIVSTRHGAEALSLLDQGPVDAILLDARMPVMDGVEFAKLLRARPGPRPPIALLTAAHDGQVARQIGAGWVLEKPFELDTLLAVVEQMVAPV